MDILLLEHEYNAYRDIIVQKKQKLPVMILRILNQFYWLLRCGLYQMSDGTAYLSSLSRCLQSGETFVDSNDPDASCPRCDCGDDGNVGCVGCPPDEPACTYNGTSYNVSIVNVYNVGHYNDVIMRAMASQITGVSIVYSTVSSDQRKHQSSASLACERRIHRSPVNSTHKGPVTRKMFLFDEVIMNVDFCDRL